MVCATTSLPPEVKLILAYLGCIKTRTTRRHSIRTFILPIFPRLLDPSLVARKRYELALESPPRVFAE